jgi:S-DNA-T family DNA segregation ATPase FtsK/SpoIIIE
MPDSPTRPIQPAAFSMPQNVPYKQEPLWEELQKDPDEDPMTSEAIAIIRKERRASISMLQRKLRIGYTRAARMIEALESRGVIGPPNPQTKVREVLDYGSAGRPAEGKQPGNYKEQ